MFIIGLVIVLCALVFLVSALIKLCTEKPRVRNDRVKLLNKGAAQSSNSAEGESQNDSQNERYSIKDGTENNDTNENSAVPGATKQAKNRSKASESSHTVFSTHTNKDPSQYQFHTNSQNDNINNLSGITSISNSLPNPEVNYAHDNRHLNYLQNHQEYLQHQHYERPKYSALGSSSAESPRLILSKPIDAHGDNMVPKLHLPPHSCHYHQQHDQVHPLYDNMGSQRYRMT
ncbi:MAG: hypothetical protein MHMPM18_004914, partial [Marteilia pararefringens]